MDIAREFAERGAFIVPQESASFRYSGRQCFDRRNSGRGVDFERATGVYMDIGAGVDTNIELASIKAIVSALNRTLAKK